MGWSRRLGSGPTHALLAGALCAAVLGDGGPAAATTPPCNPAGCTSAVTVHIVDDDGYAAFVRS